MFGNCSQNPKSSQHCLCVAGERCCWCGSANPAHGPYRDQFPFKGLQQYAERSMQENRCKCGAPGGALHGCTSIETARARVWTRTNAIAGESTSRGLLDSEGTGGAGAR